MAAAFCGKDKLDVGTVCASGIKTPLCACGINKLDYWPPVLVVEMVLIPRLLETMYLARKFVLRVAVVRMFGWLYALRSL